MENFPSLAIDPALATLWPNTALGLMGLEARVFADTSSIWEEFERKTGPQLRKDLSTIPLAQMPGIGEARSAFKAFGTDPGRYRVSSEALYRRLRQGKDIYRINSLVDTNNVLSLQCGHSCGIYDAAAIAGNVVLRLGLEGETYQGLGKGSLPLQNMPLLSDDAGPFGSPVSDSNRTMVTQDTRRALLVVYAFCGKDSLAHLLEKAGSLFASLAGARVLFTTVL